MWTELGRVTGLGDRFAMIEPLLGINLKEEGDRFRARDVISAVLDTWVSARTLDEIKATFAGTGVCWGPYQTFRQMLREDPRCSIANPIFHEIDQPGIGRYLVAGSPLDFERAPREAPVRAPRLGEHTDQVLADVPGSRRRPDREAARREDRRGAGRIVRRMHHRSTLDLFE